MKTLNELTEEIVQTFEHYSKQGTTEWNYKIASADLSYQIGSLTKVIMQMQNFRYREGLSDQELKKKAVDELADILAEVLFIAHDLGIDMNESWTNMIESDKKKISSRS